MANFNPDTLGVYAATENGKGSLVIVNKDPSATKAFKFTGMSAGKYFVRHFGGTSGIAKWQVRYL